VRSSKAPRRVIAETQQHSQWSVIGWVTKNYYLELLRASESTLSRWSRLHLQSFAPINPHWARVVGYDPFSLCVIHKESLCISSGDINRLMTIGSVGIQGGLTSGRRPIVKIISKALSQHDKIHVVLTSFSGIRVGKRYTI
jgi:hypothetical protein